MEHDVIASWKVGCPDACDGLLFCLALGRCATDAVFPTPQQHVGLISPSSEEASRWVDSIRRGMSLRLQGGRWFMYRSRA